MKDRYWFWRKYLCLINIQSTVNPIFWNLIFDVSPKSLGLFLSQGVISHSRFTSQVGCKSISFFANSLKSLPLQTDLIKSIPISFVVCFNPLVNPIILDHKPMVDWLIDWLIDKINLIHSYWCKYIKSYSNIVIFKVLMIHAKSQSTA